MIKFLTERNPLEGGDYLRNISTGEVAGNQVNVDQSESLGESILENMVGENVYSYSFKRKDTATTMASKAAVKVGGEEIQIDPNFLFQKLAALSIDESEKKKSFL